MRLERRAMKKDAQPVLRLNGTSDIAWEELGIPQEFPYVQFYDYTKSTLRVERFAGLVGYGWPDNYHLTFSRSEKTSDATVRGMLLGGVSVAVVFRGELPESFLGVRVIDGTRDDWRFRDPEGVVVGLVAKARAKRDASGFVVELEQ